MFSSVPITPRVRVVDVLADISLSSDSEAEDAPMTNHGDAENNDGLDESTGQYEEGIMAAAAQQGSLKRKQVTPPSEDNGAVEDIVSPQLSDLDYDADTEHLVAWKHKVQKTSQAFSSCVCPQSPRDSYDGYDDAWYQDTLERIEQVITTLDSVMNDPEYQRIQRMIETSEANMKAMWDEWKARREADAAREAALEAALEAAKSLAIDDGPVPYRERPWLSREPTLPSAESGISEFDISESDNSQPHGARIAQMDGANDDMPPPSIPTNRDGRFMNLAFRPRPGAGGQGGGLSIQRTDPVPNRAYADTNDDRYEDGEVRRYGAGESYRPYNRDHLLAVDRVAVIGATATETPETTETATDLETAEPGAEIAAEVDPAALFAGPRPLGVARRDAIRPRATPRHAEMSGLGRPVATMTETTETSGTSDHASVRQYLTQVTQTEIAVTLQQGSHRSQPLAAEKSPARSPRVTSTSAFTPVPVAPARDVAVRETPRDREPVREITRETPNDTPRQSPRDDVREPPRPAQDSTPLARSPPRGPAALRVPPTGPAAARNPTLSTPSSVQVISRHPATPTGPSRPDVPSPTVPPSGPRGYVPPPRGGFSARGGRGGWAPIPARHAPGASVSPTIPPTGPSGIPTGPRAATSSTPASASPSLGAKPFNPPTGPAAHNATQRPTLAQNLISTMPLVLPAGKIDPTLVPLTTGVVKELDVHHRKLKEEEERIREDLKAKQEKLRKYLRSWDKLERESKAFELKSDLSEKSLKKLAGEELGGAAF
ncbi:hypothetical protein OQA88_12178 [Cercophora sp. LCS_1]